MAERYVTGIPEAIANLKKYQIIKTQAVKDRLKKQAFKVELQAKSVVVVDTGRLRASISTKDRKSTRLNSSHCSRSRMPSSA